MSAQTLSKSCWPKQYENHGPGATDDRSETDVTNDRFLAVAKLLRADRGSALQRVEALIASDEPSQRAAACKLLGLLALDAGPAETIRCLRDLAGALDSELAGPGDVHVLSGVVNAFGQIGRGEGLPPVLKLLRHSAPAVRHSVAASIPGSAGHEPIPEAVEALVELSADVDPDVRDWACFGLAQIEADSPQVRDALAVRLDDQHVDTAGEALAALAKLGDQRAIDRVDQRLGADEPLFLLELEAVTALGEVRWHRRLLELRLQWQDDDDFADWERPLNVAISRCDPAEHRLAKQVEAALAAALGHRLAGTRLTATLTGAYPLTRLVVTGGPPAFRSHSVWQFDHLPAEIHVDNEAESWARALLSDAASDSNQDC